ncbi:MAG: ABC transporter ATP-binding protein/permease [Endomicrobium sp.]|jgi:ABC-type bacteriocin/lantibiotic exporter with double-glycine peptidase domain|nr:ABC transporter ATP-binding protein/permease [Endomicrobium sp.]
MKKFKILNKDFIKSQIYIFITIIILQLFFLVNPFIYKKIIDEAVLKNNLNLFFKYIFIYLIFALIKLLFEYLDFICAAYFQNKNYLILNNIFFTKFLKIKENILKKKAGGEIQHILNNDINNILVYVTSTFANLSSNLLSALAALFFIFKLNTKVGFISLATCSIMLFVSNKFYKKNIALAPFIRDTSKDKLEFLLSIYNYSGYIKSNRLIDFFKDKYFGLNNRYNFYLYKEACNDVFYGQINSFLMLIVGILVLIFMGLDLFGGKTTLGTILAVQALLPLFYNPMLYFFNSITRLGKTKESLKRLEEFGNYEEEVYGKGLKIDKIKTINLDNIKYSHDNKKILYENLTKKIEIGKINFIVGANGIGKTTLFKIILNLFDLDTGDIKVNDTSIKEIDLESYRQHFLYTSQEPFIMKGTIFENIVLNKSINQEDLIEILKKYNLYSRVNKLGGLDKNVSSGGKELSGGEKQVIEIIRFLLNDSQMILMDEPQANVDQELKKILADIIEQFNQSGVTFIIISHQEFDFKNENTKNRHVVQL